MTEAKILYELDGAEGATPRLIGFTKKYPDHPMSLIMDYCPGSTILRYMIHGTRDPRLREVIIQSLRKAVDHIHKKGYIHLDLHSNNIIVDDTNQ